MYKICTGELYATLKQQTFSHSSKKIKKKISEANSAIQVSAIMFHWTCYKKDQGFRASDNKR